MWKSVWQLQKKYCVLHLNKNSVAWICRPCLDSISKQLFTFNSLEQSLNGEWKKKKIGFAIILNTYLKIKYFQMHSDCRENSDRLNLQIL